MTISRSMARVIFAALPFVASASLAAQGITSGAISGTVSNQQGAGVGDAQIQIINRSTGYSSAATTRDNGYYFVQGLEVGGPYTVRVRRIGYRPAEVNDIRVTLSRTTRVDLVIEQAAQQLAGVVTTAAANEAEFSASRQGAATVVGDTLIRRLPTLQRDFTDLVKLTPQVVPNAGGQGPSAAGGYNRLNNFTVDGANQNDRFNLGSSGGQPGGATGGRIMSQEAVKEFQVLLSPTDVRYGNFAGMTLNAVTKTGTNEYQGGATYTFRTPYMAANVDQIRSSGFRIKDYGFHFGGPIIKDKLHFFVAPEWQQRTDPTSGPILLVADQTRPERVGTSTAAIATDSLKAFISALATRPGFSDAAAVGSFDRFPRRNPIINLMGRIDWSINAANRATLRILDNTAEQDEFDRNLAAPQSNVLNQSRGIRLTSNSFTRQAKNRSFAAQLISNWTNGMSNELLVGYNTIRDVRIVPVNAPEISLGITPVGGGTAIAVTAGTERFSPGNDLKQKILEVSENFTYPFGDHTFTVGGRYEYTDIYNFFLSGAGNGAWLFPNLNALTCQAPTTCIGGAGGTPAPSGYAFSYANSGDIAAKFRGNQISFYAQDLWYATPRVAVTIGLRADAPDFLDRPKLNNDLLNRSLAAGTEMRTDWIPKRQILWSPRVGVNWDVTGRQTTQVRANAGVFTGNTPYILIGNGFSNTGLGGVTVSCTGAAVPTFSTDVSSLPKSCAGQPAPTPGNAGTVGVNLTDPNFKYPQNFTTTFGVDHWLPWQVLGTFEALYRKDINALYVRDLNLRGPRMVGGAPYRDVNGRILYADTILAAGTIQNSNQKYVLQTGIGSFTNFNEGAIFLTNAKAGHSYTLTGQLKKRFSRAFEMTSAYTYTQAKDVQSLTSDRAISNWRFSRQHAGLEFDPNDARTSNFQRPHRLIAYGTWTGPWKKNQTDVSLYLEYMSGMSFGYNTNNDINGDGVNGNDMIYVPLDATDPTEVRIGRGLGAAFVLDAADAIAFNRFISMQPCLNSQRGQLMKRNSCQAPFTKRMDVNVRQALVDMRGQQLSLQLDVFNFPNLLNKKWGQNSFPIISGNNNQAVLNTAGKTAGPLNTSLWNFNVPSAILNSVINNNSAFSRNPNTPSNNYQMQLTVRYSY